MKKISVFKNYEPGEPTCRLYVKNISKQVEEKVGGISLVFSKISSYSLNTRLFNFKCVAVRTLDFLNDFLFCAKGPQVHLRTIYQPIIRAREKHVCKLQMPMLYSLPSICMALKLVLSPPAVFDSGDLPPFPPESF